jgi:hypothetical protein
MKTTINDILHALGRIEGELVEIRKLNERPRRSAPPLLYQEGSCCPHFLHALRYT